MSEGLQNAKCDGRTSFVLTDRSFTCRGEVVAVKACGGSTSSSGIHFYLSLYATSTDSWGNSSIVFPEVIKSHWGFAGSDAWKAVTQNAQGANTPADSQCTDRVCYSPGDFLGVTVYSEHGKDTRYASIYVRTSIICSKQKMHICYIIYI